MCTIKEKENAVANDVTAYGGGKNDKLNRNPAILTLGCHNFLWKIEKKHVLPFRGEGYIRDIVEPVGAVGYKQLVRFNPGNWKKNFHLWWLFLLNDLFKKIK